MNPSSLPPQGRYSDPRIQQMVLDELGRKDIRPEKFYFTSDDWMVSYDGPVPAWNSVFGIAPYRKDGQTYYAECGVSQRYDPHTAQWGEPAATVKEGLPLGDADFEAAPGSLSGVQGSADGAGASDGPQAAAPDGSVAAADRSGAGAPGPSEADVLGRSGTSTPDGSEAAAAGRSEADVPGRSEASAPDSSQTVLAPAVPASVAGLARNPESTTGEHAAPAGQDAAAGGLPGFVGSADNAPSDAAPGDAGQSVDDERATDLATTPAAEQVSAVAGDASLAGAASDTGRHAHREDAEPPRDDRSELREPDGDASALREPAGDASALREPAEQDAVAGSEAQQRDISHPGGGSAVYGGDAIHASGSSDERGGAATVSGYALTVREDGTAELQVPLGGQVTLRWAGQ